MTRRRLALEFLVLLTLASLATALVGCSPVHQVGPDSHARSPGKPSAVRSSASNRAPVASKAAARTPATKPAPTPAPAPMLAGNHEFGRIDANGLYTAPDGSFTVGPPHAPRSYEFQNMRYTDGVRSADGVRLRYVIFGPGPSDPTAYHVVVATGLAGQQGLAGAARARAISDGYMRRYDAEHGGSSKVVVFEEAYVAGHPGAYAVYRHDPGGPDDAGFYVAFMIADYGADRIVNVMAEKLTPANPWYPGRDTLLSGTWTRFNRFAASVHLAGG